MGDEAFKETEQAMSKLRTETGRRKAASSAALPVRILRLKPFATVPVETLAAHVLERDFQAQVIELARLNGCKVHHCRPAWTGKGYRTPIQGDAGFPDLVIARAAPPLLLFVELKREGKRLTPEQLEWKGTLIPSLGRSGQVWMWWPSDWDEIVRTLAR